LSIHGRASIDAGYQELNAARARERELDDRCAVLKPLADEHARAERAWVQRENDVRTQLKVLAQQYQQAKADVAERPALEQQAAGLRRAVAEIPALDKALADLDAQRSHLQHRDAELRRDDGIAKAAIVALEHRIEELKSQEGGRCRVCNAPLSPERVAETLALYQDEIAGHKAQQKDVWAEAKRIKVEMTGHDAERAAVQVQRERASVSQGELGLMEARLERVMDSQKRVDELRAEGALLRKALDDQTFDPELRALRERLRPSVDELAAVEPELASTRRQVAEFGQFERKHAELSQAGQRMDGLTADRARLEARITQRRESVAAIAKELAANQDVTAQVAAIEAECDTAERGLAEVEQSDDRVQREIGRVEQQIANCGSQRARKETLSPQLNRFRKDSECYDQLAKAFGKKGVQAVIIENAIPELQEHANDVLGRLTDDAMHVSFDTLQESKTRPDAPIETLKINVSDSMGIRPLEMYSGGEGFRAAFAIRIALSKLLAHRAGARLQTLIIDEGFGTQDGKGREKLIDALNALKDDFEKVIVITHIDELKDAFATRIEVMKTAMGSQLAVIEGSAG
jgi:exonuclease SbcC